MKKSFLILAAAAGMFAACTNEDAVLDQPVAQQGQTPLAFDAYVNRATTRAGAPGTITATELETAGFGVFAYYTDNEEYSAQYSTPNFMYNQQVKGTSWDYAPVKYWPNEYGTGANSDDTDKLTFFAYAPWVNVEPATGIPADDNKKNITELTRNTATGDPFVKYVVDTDPATSVDLLWGVQPATATYSPIVGAFTAAEGAPYLDLVKPTTSSKIKFNFKHALAKLNVTVDAFVDGTDKTNAVAANNKIYIRSIQFSGFATEGALNLNNETAGEPSWFNYEAKKAIEDGDVIFYDGRKDGKEATQNGEQKSELPVMLNTALLQDAGSTTAGVTNTAANLFKSSTDTAPIFVIPTGAAMNVTIVYDVETEDKNLAGYLSDGTTHGSSIENKIYKETVFAKIEAGKAYTLNLHLGMTSVKFEADVTDWDDQTAVNSDLPSNQN